MALTFSGYIPKRRGVLEHLYDRRMTLREYIIYDILLIWADHRSGIAVTNAPGLVFLSGGQLEQSYVQKCLASLEEKGYIKRPFYVLGQRGDYKIFIDKYVVTDGPLKGKTLSFALTTDWENPQYKDITEDATESTTGNTDEDADGNADSNNNRKLKNEKLRSKKSGGQQSARVEKDQKQPPNHPAHADQLSGKQQQQPKLGEDFPPSPAAELPPQPGTSSPVNSPSATPDSADPRKGATRSPIDKYTLQKAWTKLVGETEINRNDNLLWDTPSGGDFTGLLADTSDSVETIIACARWGMTISDYWFKPGEGIIRSFTDFRNAYAPMGKQYKKYIAKATKEAAV